MKINFHPEAMREFIEAVDYYENLGRGLGVDFVKEIYIGIDLISLYPQAWHRVSKHARRFLIHRFPYGIVYRKEGKMIYVLAIMRLNREPNYWKERH